MREAHERGRATRWSGLAPTNSVAQDLKADGFGRAATVHSELFRLKNGRATWDARTLVVVDEAAMLDSRITGELLAEARRSGAKLVLAGDDRQLASVERGGLFAELKARHGSAAITEVTRQRVDWQRQAARDLAEGRVEEAVRAFARERAITWAGTQDGAMAKLVERWAADTAADPAGTRFVFAYTNKDVDALNAALRQVRRERGELGEDVRLETRHGPADFAVGDRVQFTDTLKAARIHNGNAGTITAIDARTGVVAATLDGPGGRGREVAWSASEFAGFRHGYAGTIYKGQGRTLDHTYLYHSRHWRRASSYVALTRQREGAHFRRDRDGAGRARAGAADGPGRGAGGLGGVGHARGAAAGAAARGRAARARARGRGAPVRRGDAGAGPRARSRTRAGSWHPGSRPGRSTRARSPRRWRRTRPRGASGRRWTTTWRARSATRARRGRAWTSWSGRTGTPRRRGGSPPTPASSGELRAARACSRAAPPARSAPGRGGWPRRSGRRWRASARRRPRPRGPTGTAWRRQRAADATGVPRLSARARAAVEALGAAGDEGGRAAAWAALRADKGVAGELDGFVRAVERRFGAEGVRALARGGGPEGARVGVAERAALAEVGRVVRAVHEARLAASAEAQRLAVGAAGAPGGDG